MSILDASSNFINDVEPDNALNDKKSRKEVIAWYSNYLGNTRRQLENKRFLTNTNLRIYFAIWASIVVSIWLWKVSEILSNNFQKYCLSDSVLITLLTTTTLNVLGLVAIVLHDLFNGKSEDKTNEVN